MSNSVQILRVSPIILESLIKFFKELSFSDIDFFSPHPFSEEEAEKICNKNGKDLYYVIVKSEEVIGYGILRGMDDGYKNPSLGIAISKNHRGKGWAKVLMLFLHSVAIDLDADYVLLKVKKNNVIASSMYEKLGYVLTDTDGDFLNGKYFLKRK